MLRVRDILNMDLGKKMGLACGENKLEKIVKNVGIHNFEELDDIGRIFGEGDVVLTTLFPGRSDPEKIIQYLKAFVDAGVAAIAVKTFFFKKLPAEGLEYCEAKGVPVILYPEEVFTEDLVVEIKNAIARDDMQTRYGQVIKKMLCGKASEEERKMLLRVAGPEKDQPVEISYFRCRTPIEEETLEATAQDLDYRLGDLLPYLGMKILKYEQGMFVFRRNLKASLSEVFQGYKVNLQDYYIGTACCTDAACVERALEESISASLVCCVENKDQMAFSEIGIYQILLPLKENSVIYQQYQRSIGKLIAYDEEKHTSLLETAACYVEHSGELAVTAKELYQHVNTIRYRLKRIQEIMGLDNGSDFYVQLYLFMKVHKIASLK